MSAPNNSRRSLNVHLRATALAFAVALAAAAPAAFAIPAKSCFRPARPSPLDRSSAATHPDSMSHLTELIERVNEGDAAARDELLAASYPELRKLERHRLRDGGRNVMIETTALVHQAYLRLVEVSELRVESRATFFGARGRRAPASEGRRDALLRRLRRGQDRRGPGVSARTVQRDWELAKLLILELLKH